MRNINKIMIVIAVVILIIGIVIYNVYNNNQINVVVEEVKIKNLPEEFEGFTILQIADLHSKSFGENQEELINLINEQDFDIIAICGDMQDNEKEEYQPFIDLLKGIDNNEEIYYTPGNHGPYPFKNDKGYTNFLRSKDEFNNDVLEDDESLLSKEGKVLRELGVKFLNRAYEIKRGDESIWISELLFKDQLKFITNGQYDNEGINIAITHYPMESVFSNDNYTNQMPGYELVLAGHYHGGQFRIPGIGAVYIPDLNKPVYFPSQERVSGLTEYGDINQYVTRGLGAGGPFDLFRFRLFNRPEINLIKLTRE